MSDFIREVNEDYRRDRTMAFFTRFQVPLAIFVVLVVVGAGGWRFWTDQQVTAAEAVNARYVEASDLAQNGKADQAQAAFEALAKDGPAGYALLSRVRAAELLAARDPEAAARAFDAIASESTPPASMHEAARLRGALLRVDREPPQAFESRYGRYAQPGGAFRNSYRELMALAAMKRADYGAAGRYLDAIIIDPEAPVGIRGRAQAFRQLVAAGPAVASAKQAPPAQVVPVGSAAPPAAANTPAASAPTASAPAAPAPAASKPAPAAANPAADKPAAPVPNEGQKAPAPAGPH